MTDSRVDLDKLRSIGHISRRTGSRSVSGREHPDSGLPYKITRDEIGNYVTEHGARGAGVSQRQDVDIHPAPVTVNLEA